MAQRNYPQDPMIQRLIAAASRSQVTRRSLLLGTGAGAAALALAACSSGDSAPALSPAADVSDSDKSVRWANWAMYMDEDDDGNYPTLLAFEEQTGIKVTYMTDVDDNNTYYGKVKDQLALGQDIGADIVTLTEWMIARLVRLGYVQDLDPANIPNMKNLAPALATPDFDPNRSKTLPWQGGFTGLCWNKEKVPEGLTTVNDLWKPEYKGRVGVLSEMRDTMGLLMLNEGIDVTGDWGTDQFNAALDVLTQKIGDGQIRNVKGGSYTEDLNSEDTLVTMAWSGDVTVLNAEVGYEKFGFAIPDAGGMLWTDTSVIPMGATHKANAEALLNYYYEPEVAAEVALWVNYVTPVVGAKEAAEKIDPELAENPLIFPDEAMLETVHVFRTLDGAQEQEYGTAFQGALLGNS